MHYGSLFIFAVLLSLIKSLLRIVELVHTACIFDALYMYTVRGYGDPTYLIRFPVSLDATIILHGATVIIGTSLPSLLSLR